MLRDLRSKLGAKGRKYPIKRDEYGLSARQRAFALFSHGLKPKDVVKEVNISIPTAVRYFAAYKKLPGDFNLTYKIAKIARRDPGVTERMVKSLATTLKISEDEVLERLQKPWALHRLIKGEGANERRREKVSKQEDRLEAALKMVAIMEQFGVEPKELLNILWKIGEGLDRGGVRNRLDVKAPEN